MKTNKKGKLLHILFENLYGFWIL